MTVGSQQFQANLKNASAHWLSEDSLAWDIPSDANVRLFFSTDADLRVSSGGLEGGNALDLQADGIVQMEGEIAKKFRHLVGLPKFRIAPQDLKLVPAILKGQFAVFAATAGGDPLAATGVQPAGVLDDLYTFDGQLGVNFEQSPSQPTLRLWAPSARSVKLHLFDDSNPATAAQVYNLSQDSGTGSWTIVGEKSWNRKFYLYEVEVYMRNSGSIERNLTTDPYSFSLSTNSLRSQIVNLDDDDLKPPGWHKCDWKKNLPRRAKCNPDRSIYELHIRDFSISDETVPEHLRGTFAAFSLDNSNGIKHLRGLARAGLTHVHLLPAFDSASVQEDRSQQLSCGDLSAFAPDSDQQQAIVEAIRTEDGFNWCYDPYHYTVPEGSYATEPDGVARILEFRSMVKGLHGLKLQVVMDVVYNHTSDALQGDKSVLDRIVPDYYHRLNAEGGIEHSSCCNNTASELNMMEKLMLDSLRTWATQYHVDGFRFDLMGHHSRENLLKAKDMLQSLNYREDGLDGSDIYLYGEGWNFGEVADNARFIQATQASMGQNTGIGCFNDRIRDAVRGGGPFDSGFEHIRSQGFINGLYYDPNSETKLLDPQQQKDALLWHADRIRMSLAGALSEYQFIDRYGNLAKGEWLGGFTSQPCEAINYVEAHDNETLFDINQYKLPRATSPQDRVRAHNLGTSIVTLAQGVPFFHAGQDLLRSKSSDRNSYDSGDWFNILDFSYSHNGWGRGLPPRADNHASWPVSQPLLANAGLAVGPEEIRAAAAHMRVMLRIRRSSPLFRLQTAEQIHNSLAFHNTGAEQIPGLIVMSLRDGKGIRFVILFNAAAEKQRFRLKALANNRVRLHPILRHCADPVVKLSSFDQINGKFTIPARTTAVFQVMGTQPQQ